MKRLELEDEMAASNDDESAQDDNDFRQLLLRKLADFGDSLLDEDDFTERKRKAAKRRRTSHDESNKSHIGIKSHDNGCTTLSSSRKLKKKRKKLASAAAEQNGKSVSATAEKTIQSSAKSNTLHGEQKYLQQLRNDLGLPGSSSVRADRGKEHEHSTTQCVVSDKMKGPDVVLFQEPCRGKKKVVPPSEVRKKVLLREETRQEEQPEEDGTEMSLKRARFDVRKFGIKGMDEGDKEGATLAMLMQLGAKPPKKRSVNYRVLLESKKKAAEEEKLKTEMDPASGVKVSAAASKKKRSSTKKDRNDIGYIDGQIGRYKGGVQLVSQSELKQAAGNKRRRTRK